MLTQIAEGIANASISRGVIIAGNLRDTGLAFAGALFTWFLVWRALRLATDARDSMAEFFGDLILKLALASIVYWLLQAAIYASFVQGWVWQGLRDLAAKAAGMSSAIPGTGPLEALELSLDQFRDGVIGALVKVQDSLGSGLNPISWLVSILRNYLMTLIVAGVVIVILAIAKALAVGAFCVGAVMFGVGAALGPLFVPLLLSDRLDNYFWSWLRFLLVAAGTLVVGVIVVLLLADAVRPLAGPGGSLSGEFGSLVNAAGLDNLDFLTVATKAIVIAIFLAYVLAQIPEITNALFSGSTAGIRSGAGAALASIARGGRFAMSGVARRAGPEGSTRPRGGGRGGPPGSDTPRPSRGGFGARSGPSATGPVGPWRSSAPGRSASAERADTTPLSTSAAFATPDAGSAPPASNSAWLERNADGLPKASTREAVDRAAAAGDPAAKQMVRIRQTLARPSDRSPQRQEPRGLRSLRRAPPSDGEDHA
jgi:hypothetical protein